MVQGMIGANVEQLDALAARLTQASEALLAIQSSLRALPRYVWQGSDASRFFQQLDSELCVRIGSVASGLSAMSTAVTRNAEEQRDASNATGGLEGSGGSTKGRDWLSYADNVFSASKDFVGKGLGVLEKVAQSSKRLDDAGFFGNLGNILGGATVIADLAEGEYTQATVDVLHMATGVLGPQGWVADVGLDVFEMGIPLTDERQNAMREYVARQQFGVGIDQLSSEQAAQLVQRYDGVSGFGNMVVDSVNESVSNPKNLVSVAIGAAGNAVADVVWAGIKAFKD